MNCVCASLVSTIECRLAAHITVMATTFPSNPMMRAFAAGVRGNVPTLVWGDPGVGKTAKISAYARAWGYHTETARRPRPTGGAAE